MTEFVMDWERLQRTGVAEAVLCEGKSAAQIEAILGHAGERPLLLTRLDSVLFEALPADRRAGAGPRSAVAHRVPRRGARHRHWTASASSAPAHPTCRWRGRRCEPWRLPATRRR